VRIEQDGDLAGLQGQQQIPDIDPPDRVQGTRRLVEDDELRAGDQCDGQAEALLHALGEAAHPVVGAVGEADGGQALPPLLGWHRDTREADVQGQYLGGGEPRLVPEQLRQVADARSGVWIPGWSTEQQHLAGVGPDEAEQDLDGAGLAGPVGAEQAHHFAVLPLGPPGYPAVSVTSQGGRQHSGRYAPTMPDEIHTRRAPPTPHM